VTTAIDRTAKGAERLPGAEDVLALAPHENFAVASLLLGPRTRRHLLAIYGFARLVDQLGDEVAGDRLELLDAFEVDLDRAFDGSPEHPLLRRLAATIHELGLPRAPFARLIDANRRDQRQAVYETFDELVDYCDLSANPVGELVLLVFGSATPRRIALSDRVCTALQLIEHWQDVAEDARRGRVYLPAEDRQRFGVGAEELTAATASGPLRRLLAFEVERAGKWLDDGAPLVGTLGGRARLAVAGYVGGGRATIEALAAAGYDALAATPTATSAAKLRASFRTFRRGR